MSGIVGKKRKQDNIFDDLDLDDDDDEVDIDVDVAFNAEVQLASECLALTDSEAAITAIISSENGVSLCKGALVHQIYAILSNKTAVDKEISFLRQRKKIKLLQFYLSDTSMAYESQFVMLSATYEADLKDVIESLKPGSVAHESLLQFQTFAMNNLHRVSILESDILVGGKNSDKSGGRLSNIDLQNVIAAGFLCKRRDISSSNNNANVLWFSHPILSSLRRWIESSRKEITRMIKSTRYKEVSDKELKKKKLSSPLGFKFHLYDLLGGGILVKVDIYI
jgi:hypothetical protein